ncbi:MAG: sodium-dependent transporter [Anaerovoracaceae bacterium]|jgi:NSS family neurotransmitter:Na+ symporter
MSATTIVLLIIYLVAFGGGSIFMLNKSMKKGSSSEGGTKLKDGFGSRIGFILSTVGMSVGVGAMWRFPMMCAQWGGGAFVLAFVVICVLIVIPAGWAEISLGRHFHKGTVGALDEVAGGPGKFVGWLASFDQASLFAYYPVIMALVVLYMVKSFGGLKYADHAEKVYEATNDNRIAIYLVVLCLIAVAVFICARGVANGIEKICKILLPLLFIVLIILVIRVCMIPGIAKGIEYYIHPDWSQLLNPEMWAQAAGMALFAVGLGPCILLVYGSYCDDKQDIATDFITVNVVQLFVCLLSGFVIIPAVYIYGLDPLMGKGIMFVALPKVFQSMPGGIAFMELFYLALLFAGISSSISQLEIGTSALMDEKGLGWSRKKANIAVFLYAAVIAIPCVWNDSFFTLWDNLIGNIGYCVCALCIALILGWKVGAKKVREEWYNPTSAIKWPRAVDYLYKYLVVIVLAYFTAVAVISMF